MSFQPFAAPLKATRFVLRGSPAPRTRPVFEIQGRKSGFWAAIIQAVGLGRVITFSVTPTEAMYRSAGPTLETVQIIPVSRLASLSVAVRGWQWLALLGAVPPGLLFLYGLMTVVGGRGEAAGLMAGSALPLFGAIAVFFALKPALIVTVTGVDGTTLGIAVERGSVDGERLDGPRFLEAAGIIRDLITAGPAASPAPAAVGFDPVEDEEEILEVEPVDDEDGYMPPVPSSRSRREYSAQAHDPETEATTRFREGSALFRAGDQEGAFRIWREVAQRYPNTKAGQAALRNLRKAT